MMVVLRIIIGRMAMGTEENEPEQFKKSLDDIINQYNLIIEAEKIAMQACDRVCEKIIYDVLTRNKQNTE